MRWVSAQMKATSVGPARCHSLSPTVQPASSRATPRLRLGSNVRRRSDAPDRYAWSDAAPTRCPQRRAGSARFRSARCVLGSHGIRPMPRRKSHTDPAHASAWHPPAGVACGCAPAHLCAFPGDPPSRCRACPCVPCLAHLRRSARNWASLRLAGRPGHPPTSSPPSSSPRSPCSHGARVLGGRELFEGFCPSRSRATFRSASALFSSARACSGESVSK